MKLAPISSFTPPSNSRAWASVPHPTLPLLATASSDKSARIYSLQNFQLHSALEGGHKRSVRSVAWKPGQKSGSLSLVTGSFDATAGVWRRSEFAGLEREIRGSGGLDEEDEDLDEESGDKEWEFSLVLEGHDSEIKSVAFSPSGQYLATCSRDKSVWVWEEIGAEGEDEWETVAVLQEHEGDVKAVAWCADQGGFTDASGDLLASASYDDTVRLWREDGEGEWGCVAVLEGHSGTVWGLDFEGPDRAHHVGQNGTDGVVANGTDRIDDGNDIPKARRLITCSADSTIRVWRKIPPDTPEPLLRSNNGIPSTMRPRAIGETWVCEAVLPKVHDRAIYSVSWSKKSGRVVSTGSDSLVVVYEERPKATSGEDTVVVDAPTGADGQTNAESQDPNPPNTEWHVVATLPEGHGPYEINHATWSSRFDGDRKGEEEMVVTTGDDGAVKAWALEE